MKNKMLSGTFWMSLGSILSRVLGVVYIIPWLIMLGSVQNQRTGQALFNVAYNAYALFFALGTSGFPTAISRKIAIYNSQQRFKDSRHLFRAAIAFMILSGLICGIVFYLLAPTIAAQSPVSDQAAAITVTRALVPALFILPVMSVIRGWFEGNQDMKPFGVSQVVEQFIRILTILLMTFLTFNLFHQSLATAVAWSTFAAFTGALASLLYLIAHYKSESAGYYQQLKSSLPATKINVKQLFWQIFKEAIPFVYLGSGITLGQLIDQFTFKQIMNFSTNFSAIKIQNLYTLFSANPNKITNVIISFSMAVGATTLPMLAGTLGQKEKIAAIIQDNLRLLFALLTPVTIILALLAARINTIFYSYDLHGNWLLFWAILMTFILSAFSDVCTMIQSLGNHRLAVILLSATLILKLIIQYPLVFLLRDYGALLATALAFGVTTWIGLRYLKGLAPDVVLKNFADLSLITRANLVFAVLAIALFGLVNLMGISYSKLGSLLFSIIYGIPAALIYVGVAYWYNLPQIVLKLKSKSQYKHF